MLKRKPCEPRLLGGLGGGTDTGRAEVGFRGREIKIRGPPSPAGHRSNAGRMANSGRGANRPEQPSTALVASVSMQQCS